MQGVTTEVGGNCGDSVFPLDEDELKGMDKDTFEEFGIHVDWNDLNGFLDRIEKNKTSINYATFTGQGRLRGLVVGRNDVPATREQLTKMQEILRSTMEQGSFGLSSGLEYAPGSYADTEELVELCKTCLLYTSPSHET